MATLTNSSNETSDGIKVVGYDMGTKVGHYMALIDTSGNAISSLPVTIDQTTPGTTNAIVPKNSSGTELFTAANPGQVTVNGSSTENVIRKTLTANINTPFIFGGTEQLDYVVQPGIYFATTDGHYDSSYTSWQCLKVACTPGDKLICTASVTGAVTAMATFFKSDDTLLGLINQGADGTTTLYLDCEFTVPTNAAYVAITGQASATINLEKISSTLLWQGFDILNVGSDDIYYCLDSAAVINGDNSILIPASMGRTTNAQGLIPYVISSGTPIVQIVGWR